MKKVDRNIFNKLIFKEVPGFSSKGISQQILGQISGFDMIDATNIYQYFS